MGFGNSDGDLQMLEWTAVGSGARFSLHVHDSDANREWAYDRKSHICQLDKGLGEATAKGLDSHRHEAGLEDHFPARKQMIIRRSGTVKTTHKQTPITAVFAHCTACLCIWLGVPACLADAPAGIEVASIATGNFPALDSVPLAVYASDEPSASATAPADGGDESSEDLVKKLQNPVANLISVPLQYNADFGIGSNNATKSTLNIQPVIPITLNGQWNLITRTILPIIYQDSISNGISSRFGLGDTVQSFFLSPAQSSVIWGVGPVFLWPTATNDILGSGKYGAGPTVVVLKQTSGWTFGMLANQIWSYAGAGGRASVNATFLQPFVSYILPTYTTFGFNTESTYNWSANQWTIPLNLTVSQLLKIHGLPVQFTLGGRYYAERPAGGPDWGLRFVVTFLFPK
jgi:hypothetical protein